MTRTYKAMIAFAILLFLLAAGGTVWFCTRPQADVVEILSGGEMLYRIDLALVTEAYELEIKTEHGLNTLLVEPGGISVIYADCADKTCVSSGKLRKGTVICCVPNGLVIRCAEDEGADAYAY